MIMKKLRKNPFKSLHKKDVLNYFYDRGFEDWSYINWSSTASNSVLVNFDKSIVVVLDYISGDLHDSFIKIMYDTKNELTDFISSPYRVNINSIPIMKKHLNKLIGLYNYVIDLLKDLKHQSISNLRNNRLIKNPPITLKYNDVIKYFINQNFIFGASKYIYQNVGSAIGISEEGHFLINLEWNKSTGMVNLEKSIIYGTGRRKIFEYSLTTNPKVVVNKINDVKIAYKEGIEIIEDILKGHYI